MKFQLKAIAAAVVLAAAVPAQAALDVGNAATGSSLTLTVFDRAANVSAVFDLGKNYSDFSVIGNSFADSNVDNLGTNFSWDLTTGDYATVWSTFASLTDSANWQFVVLATDNVGSGAGSRGIISTLNQASVTPLATSFVSSQLGAWDSYLVEQGSPAALIQNHTTVTNGGSVSNTSGGFANALDYFGNDKNKGTGSVSAGNVGQSLAIYQQVIGGSVLAQSAYTTLGNSATFKFTSDGALTYATAPVVQVPEADTWAMMLLGLGFMGFASRRKQA